MEQRVRYPPFEPGRFEPESLPIATQQTTLHLDVPADKLVAALEEKTPSFRLGNEDGWLIEQRYIYQDEIYDDTNIHRKASMVETAKIPRIVKLHRRGWYLTPNPVHRAVRKFLSFSVSVLLVALGYLFIEPVLSAFGIPGVGTGTVRIGLLDYPALAIIVVPLLFAPLILRVGANFLDLSSQRSFLRSAPKPPIIECIDTPTAGKPLRLKVSIPEQPEGWSNIEVMWRVGVLPPAREEVFSALGRSKDAQPPPGLTTALPHHWEVGQDDGTGGGEEAPMEHHQVEGGLFLRPMRVMEFGGRVDLTDKEMILDAPPNTWPGTVSSPLIRVHWEILIRIERTRGGSLMFVKPLAVAHPSHPVSIAELPTNDGRSESDQL
ncbi:MAG TPA: hypothetical protein HA356_04875 [Candidatus Poseidoniaceae archaeon]|nr:hypothetical protein [Candidatus Poseidoniaceae archaeon]|tara:strand:- start:187 stop:1320 length:1134 start_codon:yes stop_codon:yes gene_type:complete